VLDANILIRAVLGSRVLDLLRKYAGQVEFMAPDVAFLEAREHLPTILESRKIPVAPAMATLDLFSPLVQTVETAKYAPFETVARQRIDQRDEGDWPVGEWRGNNSEFSYSSPTPCSSATTFRLCHIHAC
jgi:predicted nucleic acid-binding protein